jgi:beta-galactosidase
MKFILCSLLAVMVLHGHAQQTAPARTSFNKDWKFNLANNANTSDDSQWRVLDLPHDWSVELPFDSSSPTGTGGGALRGGMGWYKKSFTIPSADKNKRIFIEFDGVYRNSEVWINDHYLGLRPNGYISFRYELTPYLKYGGEKNTIVVKVDNSQQPNSRWYSGSGIYRNVWLVKTGNVFVDYQGTHITTPVVSSKQATVTIKTKLVSSPGSTAKANVVTNIYNAAGKLVASHTQKNISIDSLKEISQDFTISAPVLWSIENPYLYRAVTKLTVGGKQQDEYATRIGIRSFEFNVQNGFFLNGKKVKIRGVCNHHDLGCLGSAINRRGLQRQLEILKQMGCNGIRTSHNPPAPELLDLCDEMGFIVMDEAFDMWKISKTKYDYSLDWDKWYKRDLEDQLLRDRNHPSVFMWSVGNEIMEQWAKDTIGKGILRELQAIVKNLDDTRPTVMANNETNPWNELMKPNIVDMIGYNYNHKKWDSVFQHWYAKPFIVTESVSALQTRGHYDMPSDSIRRWPARWDVPLENANVDLTCSAYENCSTPWGTTHEETLKEFEKYPHISGMYIWTGFDYLGEPTPYGWPARSSYFGIIDLAGFPKDAYYLYQSVWTSKPVLHLFPHWNWKKGQPIDLWAYYNNADEVELYINGVSQGIRKKQGEELHVMWRVLFQPGTIKAVSRKNGKIVLTREIKTAGKPAKIILEADRKQVNRNDGLSFITVKIVDAEGNMVPYADNLVQFTITGGSIAGVDNGLQTSLESFKDTKRKAFNGLCLAVLKPDRSSSQLKLTATAEGLQSASLVIPVSGLNTGR